MHLTRLDSQFVWSSVHEQAFTKAKELIAKAPCLAYFDPNKEITLQTDASEHALGDALLQPNSNGKLQPIAFMFCQMRPNKRMWAQIEKETLAICAACEKWDYGCMVLASIFTETISPWKQSSKNHWPKLRNDFKN